MPSRLFRGLHREIQEFLFFSQVKNFRLLSHEIFRSADGDYYLLLLIRNLTSSTRSHNPPVIIQRKTFNNTLPKLIKYLLVLNQIIGFASGFVIRSSKNRPRQIRLSGSSNELNESRLRPAGAVKHPLQQQRVPS